jgi:hypothetical protein
MSRKQFLPFQQMMMMTTTTTITIQPPQLQNQQQQRQSKIVKMLHRMLQTVKDTAMLANGKDTGGLHMIIVQIPAAIATVIAKTFTVTEDVGHGIVVAGVTAPEAGTRIGWQRTVQGPVTPAHKCGHNFHADRTQSDVQIHGYFLI